MFVCTPNAIITERELVRFFEWRKLLVVTYRSTSLIYGIKSDELIKLINCIRRFGTDFNEDPDTS